MPLYSLPLNKAVLIFFPPIDDDCTDPTEQQSSQAQVVQVLIKQDGYASAYYVEHKPWTYGKQIQFKLGTQGICAAEDKWVFVFDPTPGPGNVR
ncbi:hypothetical protein DXG03_003632 [Asterophora parasitica]|uniref:Uncharacterized protein n=1 Tax=Asterophora parasitica TaxID=117018 RepID=A0A9P7G3E8_9AGAR|nr:hypothetical protein DXG03_003632 [Asterophora parasitica]